MLPGDVSDARHELFFTPLTPRTLGAAHENRTLWPLKGARRVLVRCLPTTTQESRHHPLPLNETMVTPPATMILSLNALRPSLLASAGFEADLERLRKASPRPYRLLSALIGHRRPYLSHAIRLLTLPHEVQRLIRSGTLRPRHARCLVTLPGPEAQIACAHEIVDRHLSAAESETLARAYRGAPGPRSARAPPAAIRTSCAWSRRSAT